MGEPLLFSIVSSFLVAGSSWHIDICILGHGK